METSKSKTLTTDRKGSLMRETRTGFLFLLPALIPLTVFWILPVLFSTALSFTKWDMISPTIRWMGFKNYTSLFRSSNFWKILQNTFVFALGSTIPNILMGLILALALAKARKGAGLYRTMMFVPYITPMVAVSIVWSSLYDPNAGLFNYIRSLAGLAPLKWTGSKDTAML